MHATITVNYRGNPNPGRPVVTIFIGNPFSTAREPLEGLLNPFFEGQVFENPQDCLAPMSDLLNTLPDSVLDRWTVMLVTFDGTYTLKKQGESTFTSHNSIPF